MKYFLLLFVLLNTLLSADEKQTLTIGLGPYMQSQPYKGVDSKKIVSPVFFYDNSLIYIRWTRVGVYFLGKKTEAFSWGFSLTAQPLTNGYLASDSKYLKGMQDKQNSWEGGLAFSASWDKAYVEMIYLLDLLNKSNASHTKIELGYRLKYPSISFYPSIVAIYQSADFLNYYYGVSKQESSSSLYDVYTPKADFKFAVQSYIRYPLTEDLSAFFNAKVNILSKEAKHSPLTNKDYYYSGIASLIYTFDF